MIVGYVTVGNQPWAVGTAAFVVVRRGFPDRANVGLGPQSARR
jgi:hypothetical protein